MYLDGVKIPSRQMVRRYVGAPQTQAPAGMRFSDTSKRSLTNAEMRAVTEWRFGPTNVERGERRLKWDAYRQEYVPTI